MPTFYSTNTLYVRTKNMIILWLHSPSLLSRRLLHSPARGLVLVNFDPMCVSAVLSNFSRSQSAQCDWVRSYSGLRVACQ